ncbi:MAG: NAD(P)-dependent oxidoreductase [Candidatus Moranbacteria bacterium]|nr:NAD(P)-dependent oxidoreductase [Candidatus Moranbacteria bacterium]
MEKKKILILGRLGMLGQELFRVFAADDGYAVTAWDKNDVDITDFVVLEGKITTLAPDIVINAAAYNAVDACEKDDTEFERALILNRDVPGFLAGLSVKRGFLLVHYSTDYVFDGALEKNKAETGCCGGGCCGGGSAQVGYNEEALPNPLSRYGESKYAGERAVQEQSKRYYLIRLSKLFGKPGKSPQAKQSFFSVMLGQTETKAEVQAVDDEKSCFTYAPDLAVATKELIESESDFGTYHLTNEGTVTWYEAVEELYWLAGKTTKVVAVGSETFPRPARRPACSVLLNTKRPKLRPYTAALKEFLAAIK